MHSLYVPYAMNMKKMKYTFYYIVLYTMTYARNICVPENVSPSYALFKMAMERNGPLMIHKLSFFIYYALKQKNDYISGTNSCCKYLASLCTLYIVLLICIVLYGPMA